LQYYLVTKYSYLQVTIQALYIDLLVETVCDLITPDQKKYQQTVEQKFMKFLLKIYRRMSIYFLRLMTSSM